MNPEWFKLDREKEPFPDDRRNALVIDLRSDENLNIDAIEAGVAAAKQVSSILPNPTLLVSGGIDSQAMMFFFLEAGIPFNAVTYTYGKENEDDLNTLFHFANENNVKIDVRNFDARKFITSPELIDVAKQYDVASPQIATYLKLLDRHDENVITSGNFVSEEATIFNYTTLALLRYKNQTKRNFVPFFLSSTPALAYAVIKHSPKFNEVFHDPQDKVKKLYTQKCNAYRQVGIPIIPQDKKRTGFEAIKESFDEFDVPFNLKNQFGDMPSKRPFDFLYRYNLFNHISLYSEKTVYVHDQRINI